MNTYSEYCDEVPVRRNCHLRFRMLPPNLNISPLRVHMPRTPRM